MKDALMYVFWTTLTLALTFSGGVLHGETRVSGVVSGEWTRQGSPYIATGDLVVRDSTTLRIEAGVEVRFEGNYAMYVYGSLRVEGAERDSVLFAPIAGGESWGGIRFLNADEGTRLAYAVVVRGRAERGQGDIDTLGSGGNIFISGGEVTLSRCRISEGTARSVGGGIAIWRSSPRIEYTVVSGNSSRFYGGGIGIAFGSTPVIERCIIEGNTAQVGGGGVLLFAEVGGEIAHTIIRNNRAVNVDNGVGGGALIIEASSPTIHHTAFLENGAPSGGGIYVRGEGSRPLVDWCYFYGNAANEGSRVGGGLYIRGAAGIEVRYTIFKQNNANFGGGIYVKEVPRCRLHHLLFIQNGATRAGGAVGTSNDLGEHPLQLNNCTFFDNRNIGGDRIAHTVYARQGSLVRISSSIVVGMQPHFGEANQVLVTYSHVQGGFPGEGNVDQDPAFILPDTLFLLRGNSTCRNSGEPALGMDPDSTQVDRGWIHFPEDALRGLESRELEVAVEVGRRERIGVQLINRTPVPFVADLVDRWEPGGWRFLMDATSITGDRTLMAAAFVGGRFYLAGGNNGQDSPRIYVIDENFNLRRSYRQPGNVAGLGFEDLATDGNQTLYGVHSNYVSEFTLDGELGDELAIPRGIAYARGLGVDLNYSPGFMDYYLGGDEGFISVADVEMWQRDSIFVGDTIRSLAVKGNGRYLYAFTEPRPGVAVINLVNVSERRVIPLYPLMAPRGERIGGVEIFHHQGEGKGILVGIWRGEGEVADKLFALDLYTTWIVTQPSPRLLHPGDTMRWEFEVAGDQVPVGIYEDRIFLTVNGWGENGDIRVMLRSWSDVKDKEVSRLPQVPHIISLYPQPFNAWAQAKFYLPHSTTYRWMLSDPSGRIVKISPLQVGAAGVNSVPINASFLPSGVYYLMIEFPPTGMGALGDHHKAYTYRPLLYPTIVIK